MKLTIPKTVLLQLVARTVAVADKRSPMPALGCALLEADDGLLRVSATDLRLGVESAAKCDVAKAGSIAIPAQDLLARVKSMPEGSIVLDASADGKVTLKATGSARRHTLSCFDGREFPVMPVPKGEAKRVKLPAEALARLLAQTDFAASEDNTRPHINGVLIEWSATELSAAATDSHRLSLAIAKHDFTSAGQMLLPLKAVREVRRMLEGEEEEIAVALKGSWAIFTVGAVTLSCALADSTFPPYRQIIPQEHTTCATIPREGLLEAARSVGLASEGLEKGKGGGVILVLSPKKLTIDAGAPDTAPSHDELAVDCTGKTVTWRMNHDYLIEALGAVDVEEVELSGCGELDPVCMRPVGNEHGNYLGVLMPMR